MLHLLPLFACTVLPVPQGEDVLPRALPREERSFRAGESTYAADVGRVLVLADRSRPQGARIELAVARLKGSGPEGATPIVFLAGGPGEGATAMVDHPLWASYLELGDVVLIDQRGTGRSQPSLSWSSPEIDAGLLFGERPAALAAVLAWCKEAKADLASRGVELSAFTTSASADDVADVLDVLGYESARVLAHSYGTHLALDLMRRHPERVERCALLGVAGPDDLLKPAGDLEPFVVELARRATADSEVARVLPDLTKALDAALARARKEPFRFSIPDPESDAARELSIGSFGLQRILLFDLGDPSDLCVLPRMLHELARGETGTLSWFAAKRYAAARRLPLAFFALRGSSGVSPERRARIERDAQTSRFADARNFPFPEVLEVLGIRPDEAFLAPVASHVPCLLVSGTLDANTPVHQAEAVARTLSRATQLVVENAGHDDLLHDAPIRERVVSFLAGDEPGEERFAVEPYRFAPMAGVSDAHPALIRR